MFTRLTAILGALSLVFICLQPAAAEDGLNPTQQQEVKDLIRELLRSNPEIIIQAVEEYRRQQQLVRRRQLHDLAGGEQETLLFQRAHVRMRQAVPVPVEQPRPAVVVLAWLTRVLLGGETCVHHEMGQSTE